VESTNARKITYKCCYLSYGYEGDAEGEGDAPEFY
jgi:hypothetical protein